MIYDRSDTTSIQDLIIFVQELHDKGAVHKSGRCLRDSTRKTVANKMIEEAVELHAEAVVTENRVDTIEEAGDLLAVWLHLLLICDISFQEVVNRCDEKLCESFTIPDCVTSEPIADPTASSMFHVLWTAHAKCDNYDKREWRDFAVMMRQKHGIEL